jgi:hypothetical protein
MVGCGGSKVEDRQVRLFHLTAKHGFFYKIHGHSTSQTQIAQAVRFPHVSKLEQHRRTMKENDKFCRTDFGKY